MCSRQSRVLADALERDAFVIGPSVLVYTEELVPITQASWEAEHVAQIVSRILSQRDGERDVADQGELVQDRPAYGFLRFVRAILQERVLAEAVGQAVVLRQAVVFHGAVFDVRDVDPGVAGLVVRVAGALEAPGRIHDVDDVLRVRPELDLAEPVRGGIAAASLSDPGEEVPPGLDVRAVLPETQDLGAVCEAGEGGLISGQRHEAGIARELRQLVGRPGRCGAGAELVELAHDVVGLDHDAGGRVVRLPDVKTPERHRLPGRPVFEQELEVWHDLHVVQGVAVQIQPAERDGQLTDEDGADLHVLVPAVLVRDGEAALQDVVVSEGDAGDRAGDSGPDRRLFYGVDIVSRYSIHVRTPPA